MVDGSVSSELWPPTLPTRYQNHCCARTFWPSIVQLFMPADELVTMFRTAFWSVSCTCAVAKWGTQKTTKRHATVADRIPPLFRSEQSRIPLPSSIDSRYLCRH